MGSIDIEGLDQNIYLQSVDCQVPLSRIYKGVDFEGQ